MALLLLIATAAGAATVDGALGLLGAGNLDGAVSELEAWVDLNPVDTRGLYYLGYAYYEKGMMEKARLTFEEVYLLDPDFSPPNILAAPTGSSSGSR